MEATNNKEFGGRVLSCIYLVLEKNAKKLE
jgi:hypothetical protein